MLYSTVHELHHITRVFASIFFTHKDLLLASDLFIMSYTETMVLFDTREYSPVNVLNSIYTRKLCACRRSKTAEENTIKLFKMHLPIEEQYLHQVNIMLLELDLRMLLYFLSKTMFELLYILPN